MLNPKLIFTDLEKKKSPLPSESAVISMLCRTHRSRHTKLNTSAKHTRSNQGWNKQFDEPESFFRRILIVHLQVRKLLETSEIFWKGGRFVWRLLFVLDFSAEKYRVGLCISESLVREKGI